MSATHPDTAALIRDTQRRGWPVGVSPSPELKARRRASLIARKERGLPVGGPSLVCGPAEAQMLRDMRAAERTVLQCAAKLGYSHGVIRRWIAELGLPKRIKPPGAVSSLTKEQKRIILAARADHWPCREIARRMGLNPNQVIGVCFRAGLTGKKMQPRVWPY